MTKWSLHGIIAMTGIITLVGCYSNAESVPTVESVALPVQEIKLTNTVLQQTYVADIQAIQNVEIRNRVTGFLDKIFIDEGEAVRKGQPLFQMNDEEYRAEVTKARANWTSTVAEHKAAAIEVERIQVLVNKKIVSAGDLEVAKAKQAALEAKIEEAHSALLNAEKQLTYTIIRAPFDGIVNRIPMKKGSLLAEGTLLTTVSDISAMYAYFNLSEREYLQFSKDKSNDNPFKKVNLQLADGTVYPLSGQVETSASEFDKGTGSIAFRAKFANPERILKHGATGKILISNAVENAIMVPQKAVFEIQDRSFVYVLKDDNTVEMKSFVPQSRLEDQFLVSSGLEAGETIVCEGVQNIKNGMTISPVINHTDSTDAITEK